MDASPTERQSTGTVSLLDDGPQRSTSVFCSLSFNLFFVVHMEGTIQREIPHGFCGRTEPKERCRRDNRT